MKRPRYSILPLVEINIKGAKRLFVLTQVAFCHVPELYCFNDVRAIKTDPFRGAQMDGESHWEAATRVALKESCGLLDLTSVRERVAAYVRPNSGRNAGHVYIVKIAFEEESNLFKNFLLDFDHNCRDASDIKRKNIFGLVLEDFDTKCQSVGSRDASRHVPQDLKFVQGDQFRNCMKELKQKQFDLCETVFLKRHVQEDETIVYKPCRTAVTQNESDNPGFGFNFGREPDSEAFGSRGPRREPDSFGSRRFGAEPEAFGSCRRDDNATTWGSRN